jgi:hypothetical protein
MHLLISVIAITGLTFLVIVGVLNVIADLLFMDMHRPPSLADKYFQEEMETEEWNRQVLSSYSVGAEPSRMDTMDVGTSGIRRLAG